MCLYSLSVRRKENRIGMKIGYYVLVYSFVRLDLVLCVYLLLFISAGEHKAEEMSCTWSQKMVELSQEIGLSFPWEFIPLAQPITKKASVS